MDRLKGVFSFLAVAAGVLLALRGVHLAVPLFFPETRQGPIEVATLDEVRPRLGFAPIIPAYRPAVLGERPDRITIRFGPPATFEIRWEEGDRYLVVTQHQGGPKPAHPPIARPFDDVADSTWWEEGNRNRLILARDGFWMELDTNLPARELRRFVDTLAVY
jgi:hypothetical protein